MVWNIKVPLLPISIEGTHTAIGVVCDGISGAVTAQKTALDLVTLSPVAGTLASDAAALDLTTWQSLLDAAFFSVVVHPFQEGIGEGLKIKTLSEQNAVNGLAEKLLDGEFVGDADTCILVLLSADNYANLQTSCQIMGNWLMWPELLGVANRARDLIRAVNYQNTKIKSPFVNDFIGLTESNFMGDLPSLISLAEGHQEQTPGDELKTLLDEKEQLAATHATALSGLLDLLPGVSVKVNSVSASNISSLAKSVQALDDLGHANSHSVLLAIGGKSENLTHWQEVFGL